MRVKVTDEQDERGACPAVSFRHSVTGTRVSGLWITGAGAEDRGWLEVDTGDKRMKIMCYDEMLGSSSMSS